MFGGDYYSDSFWLLLLCTAALVGRQYFSQKSQGAEHRTPEFEAFQKNYLLVYLLAFFADWLQGPYVYALYASYGFDAEAIAILFIMGFMASLIFGTFIGGVSDKYGRKLMCIAFAVFYFISGVTKVFNNFWILLIGRFLGGVSTSLLFSVFEAWMVSEHNSRGFHPSLLSDTFGKATLGNGIVAVLAGTVAQKAADQYGFVAPFMVCLVPLAMVFGIVTFTWKENYGDSKIDVIGSFRNGWNVIRQDFGIAALGAAQSAFEGAMYTFVFMWTPAIATEETKDTLPYGTIFAAFMVCCMFGSAIFTQLLSMGWNVESIPVVVHALGIGSMLAVSLFTENKNLVYLAFLVFEIGCGIYFPTYGTLRSKYIPEESRAMVMSLYRIPLNAFVVVVLIKVKYMAAYIVFSICTAAQIVSLVSYYAFVNRKVVGAPIS
eukprot:m.14768 g.14768  ORF g.14768 m.14768 type:complete len:433 (+) comp5200_c0_seq1:117-1415(+)